MIVGARRAAARARDHLLAGTWRSSSRPWRRSGSGSACARSRRCRAGGGSPDRTRSPSGNPACRPSSRRAAAPVQSAATPPLAQPISETRSGRHKALLLQPAAAPHRRRPRDRARSGCVRRPGSIGSPCRASRSCRETAPHSRPRQAARPSRDSAAPALVRGRPARRSRAARRPPGTARCPRAGRERLELQSPRRRFRSVPGVGGARASAGSPSRPRSQRAARR